MRTNDLIHQLATDLPPVRRVMPPWRATLAWLGFASLLILVAVAWAGFRQGIATRLMLPAEQVNLIAALATGCASALATFQLALPDRSARWALLPLPFAAMWLSGMGWGCLRELAEHGTLALGTSFSCMRFIISFGIPMTAAMLWMTRHAALIRPAPVAALSGLAAAAIASVGLSLVHHVEAAATVLLWHGGSVLMVCLLSWLWGPRAMRAALA